MSAADVRDGDGRDGDEAVDHVRIASLLARYARALDDHDWDTVASCFLPTAVFSHPGGAADGAAAIVERARAALTPLTASQHLLGTVVIDLDGDRASATSYFQAQHVREGAPGDGDTYLIAGTYHDDLVRTGDGWRIEQRHQTYAWRSGNRAVVARPPVA